MTNLKTAMTCQWCGRKQQANKGVIAHHGYKVAGFGYFVGSCSGSRELPFETSRDLKPRLIIALEMIRNGWEANRNEIQGEVKGITRRSLRNFKDRNATVTVTRANFEEMKVARELYCTEYNFDDVKGSVVDQINRQIDMIEKDIAAQKKLYAEWKQTHRFENGEWVAL